MAGYAAVTADVHREAEIKMLGGMSINDDGDLTIRIYTIEDVSSSTFKAASNGESMDGKILYTTKVTRKIMFDSFEYLRNILEDHPTQDVIDIGWGHPLAAALWFCVYHGRELSNAMIELPVEEVWNVIQFGSILQNTHRADVADFSKLKDWFEEVLDYNNIREMRVDDMKLFMFPCFIFDNAEGFSAITKPLAYETTGHINEKNPTSYWKLGLDHQIKAGLNGARGSLRSQLERNIGAPLIKFQDFTCDCRDRSNFNYGAALRNIGVAPYEDLRGRNPVQHIITGAAFVNFSCELPANACGKCIHNVSSAPIEKIRCDLAGLFDGLCLDCINMTRGKVDTRYWSQFEKNKYSADCRISHGESTSYWSFVSDRAIFRKFQNEKEKFERQNGKKGEAKRGGRR